MTKDFENIDRYFGGEMGMEEMQQFEQTIIQDPLLSKEFSFQKELVEGIKAARKADLKATLGKIDVSTIPSGSEITTVTKVLGGLTIAGIVALGTYFYIGDDQIDVAPTTVVNSEVVDQTTLIEQTPVAAESNPTSENMAKASTPSEKTASIEEERIPEKKDPIVINEANVSEGFDEEVEVSETEPPANYLIAKSKMSHSTLEVSIETSKKYSFHYLVKNNSLSLYGDFTELYEILEFHKDGIITTYLKYGGKYYPIDKSQSKATPLVELSEDGLLNLLDSIENNKQR